MMKIVFILAVTLNQDRMFFADFSVNSEPIFLKFNSGKNCQKLDNFDMYRGTSEFQFITCQMVKLLKYNI